MGGSSPRTVYTQSTYLRQQNVGLTFVTFSCQDTMINTISPSSLLITLSLASSVPPSCNAFLFNPTGSMGRPPSFVGFSATNKLHMSSVVVPQPTTVDLIPGIAAVDALNPQLEPLLSDLREEPFFRLYSVDMLGSCEYMPQELFECYSASCEIYAVDEEVVPQDVRNTDANEYDFDLDGWARWDMPIEDYYDIRQFPEEYTAYDGSVIWRFIHDRISFNVDETHETIDVDSWQEDFNKAVSGLHSMISAQVVRGIVEKKNNGETLEGAWTDPVAEFQRRLSPTGENKVALENLYFGYMLLLSAVSAARERLLRDCDAGKIDSHAAEKLKKVLAFPLLDDPNIGVASHKLRDHAVKDSDSRSALWEARMRTRDLFRIMNCVQCNKCRLHGKISTMGLSTAFQVLLGRSGDGGDPTRVHRVELAALMTTLSKFSTAINFCTKMMKK